MICIRWIDNDLNANEDFIGQQELIVTNAETLAMLYYHTPKTFEDNVMTIAAL